VNEDKDFQEEVLRLVKACYAKAIQDEDVVKVKWGAIRRLIDDIVLAVKTARDALDCAKKTARVRGFNPWAIATIRTRLHLAVAALETNNLELAKKRIHQLEGMHALRYGTYPVAVMRPETVLWRAIRRLQKRWVKCGGNPDYWTGRKGEWE